MLVYCFNLENGYLLVPSTDLYILEVFQYFNELFDVYELPTELTYTLHIARVPFSWGKAGYSIVTTVNRISRIATYGPCSPFGNAPTADYTILHKIGRWRTHCIEKVVLMMNC